uniref:Uncharacterized protein LOC104230675 n=1 Tax=Nicotiana sylvestris TaxID=4096 RepID=A0A1U7X4N7_NICSY|nr:PREDICTED: uncharacterized protein LOC104230675 [Nicotiana sylvestris]
MFDKKPVVVKPWEPDIDVSKEKVDRIPVWIRLKGLDIKYWGKNALTKISGMTGKPLKASRATTNKKRLALARILVEVSINQIYPTQVMFENEMGKIVKQEVYYEWKPTLYPKCKIFGHELQNGRKLHKEEAELRGKQIEKEKQVVEGTEVRAKQTEKEKQAREGTPKAGEGTSKEGGQNKGENRARGIRKETNEGNVGQTKNIQDKAVPIRNAFAVPDKAIVIQSQEATSTTVHEGEQDKGGPEQGRGGMNPLPNG